MSFITTQIGMFSYSGLSKDQMVRLREEFGVYGTDTGRMCVAALNSKNIDYVSRASPRSSDAVTTDVGDSRPAFRQTRADDN